MATIQLKRAFTFEGSSAEAIKRIKSLPEASALKLGEPMAVRYADSTASGNVYRYMLVICTAEATETSSVQLTILPAFDDIQGFIDYVKEKLGGAGFSGTADDLEYVFSSESLEISGNTQSDFNGSVIDILESLKDRLTWQIL